MEKMDWLVPFKLLNFGLVNGSPSNNFHPSRGLKQGDPLSPFLFILAAEGLNSLISASKEVGLFKGIKIGRGSLSLTHLQYADDSIIIGVTCWENIAAVKSILKWFELISGLQINFQKSVLFCVNCPAHLSSRSANILNCKLGAFPMTYLRFPVGASPSRENFWLPVIEKVESKLSSWKRRLLSAGGRLMLVNSVLTALPLYFCSLFLMPEGVVNRLNKIMRALFWGSTSNVRKTKWVAWDKICHVKEASGLGVHNIKK